MISRPHIGDSVQAKGRAGVVISVMSARNALSGMGEVEAVIFGDNQRSMLGEQWLAKFYRVGLRMLKDSAVEWFDCHDIEEWAGENKP